MQSAFVPKRLIHDNILLAHEVMNKFKNMKEKKSCIVLKVGMEKAYHIVKWKFLFEDLMQLGFHKKWIHWNKQCLTTVPYSVIVNDEVSGFFMPSRGMRQVLRAITLSRKGRSDGVCSATAYKPRILPLLSDMRLLSVVFSPTQSCDALIIDGALCLPRSSERLVRHRSWVKAYHIECFHGLHCGLTYK